MSSYHHAPREKTQRLSDCYNGQLLTLSHNHQVKGTCILDWTGSKLRGQQRGQGTSETALETVMLGTVGPRGIETSVYPHDRLVSEKERQSVPRAWVKTDQTGKRGSGKGETADPADQHAPTSSSAVAHRFPMPPVHAELISADTLPAVTCV